MSVESDLNRSMTEEIAASLDYRGRAESARSMGDEVSAALWEHIAGEEVGHYNEFKDRLNALREVPGWEQRIQYQLGHRHPSQITASQEEYEKPMPSFGDYAGMEAMGHPIGPMHRPFPQTNEDWENLGFDIEARLPASIESFDVDRQSVRDAVATAIGKREGYPDDAKRWLVQTAGKLGIT